MLAVLRQQGKAITVDAANFNLVAVAVVLVLLAVMLEIGLAVMVGRELHRQFLAHP
jgi:hypothetical protein